MHVCRLTRDELKLLFHIVKTGAVWSWTRSFEVVLTRRGVGMEPLCGCNELFHGKVTARTKVFENKNVKCTGFWGLLVKLSCWLSRRAGWWWWRWMASGGVITSWWAGQCYHTSSFPPTTTLRTPTPSLMRGDHPVFGTGLITRIFVQRRKPVQAQSTPFKTFNPMLT